MNDDGDCCRKCSRVISTVCLCSATCWVCAVSLVVRDYIKSTPAGFNHDDVFVCESRYTHKAKSFKKIKNWTYPTGRQPQLITRDIPITLTRVPSVFMTQHTRVSGSSSHSSVPVLDKPDSNDKDLEPHGDGVESSFPYPVQLENVTAVAVSNPIAGYVYYEQYCIDEDCFRLGMGVWQYVV